MVQQKKIGVQGLILTLLIVGGAVIVYSFPQLSRLFVYDRQEILNGELWRIITAPLVHFSASHIFWDILVFGIAGFAIHVAGFTYFWIVCGFADFIPGVVFLVAFPDLVYYGGLSGLSTGTVAYYCLCSMFKKRSKRVIWIVILVFMGVKILVEAAMGISVFAQADSIPFRVLPSVHIVGYSGALATVLWNYSRISLYDTKTEVECELCM